ncbi:MAG: hypothetical protein ACRDRX_04580 [Pseudonocardiaceae bacterium]
MTGAHEAMSGQEPITEAESAALSKLGRGWLAPAFVAQSEDAKAQAEGGAR